MDEKDHRIVGACSSLGDANKAAQGYLEQEYGPLNWDRYKERLIKDGRLCIRAQRNASKEKYGINVTKTTSKRHASALRTKKIYVVRQGQRIHEG